MSYLADHTQYRQSVRGHSGYRQSGAFRALGQEENVGREMVGAICAPAELSKCVGVVISSGVNGFVVAVCLDLPEEQEVPKATRNCS